MKSSPTTSFLILLSIYNGFTLAAPLQPRQDASCTTLNAAFDSNCYQSLNLGDFLLNTTSGWNATRGRTCVPGDNASYCCLDTEPSWSACFIRQATELAGKPSCDIVGSTTCNTSSYTIVEEVAAANQRKYQYVLRNIYSVYTLFATWQESLISAITNGTASDLSDLVSEVDPNGIHSVTAPNVVQAYLLGLPLLGDSNATILVEQKILSPVQTAAQAFLTGLQHAPSVAQSLLVNKTATLYPIETNGVEEYLATNTTIATLQKFIGQGLEAVMGNLDAFVQFTSSGDFSGSQDLTVSSGSGLDVALKSLIEANAHGDHGFNDLINGLQLGIAIP